MKKIIGLLALLALTALPAYAINGASGVSGHVFGPDGRPMPNARVAIFRLPLHRVDTAVATVMTNADGYFVKIPLQPGHYMLDASVPGNTSACGGYELPDDMVAHVTMHLRADAGCPPVRVGSEMVNGDLTSDVTIIH